MSGETLWYEVYKMCGCTSMAVRRKRHLPGYCPTHGTDRESIGNTDDPEIDGLTVADDAARGKDKGE